MAFPKGHNSTTEAGIHGKGAPTVLRVAALHMKRPGQKPTPSEQPTSATEPWSGIHPEREKDMTESSRQAEQQLSQRPAPFKGGVDDVSLLHDPEEADQDELETMPVDRPPAGIKGTRNMTALSRKSEAPVEGKGDYQPHADAETGGLNMSGKRRPRSGMKGSALYGD
jgi:hypothetical protein